LTALWSNYEFCPSNVSHAANALLYVFAGLPLAPAGVRNRRGNRSNKDSKDNVRRVIRPEGVLREC
jgi:hypothetical protein